MDGSGDCLVGEGFGNNEIHDISDIGKAKSLSTEKRKNNSEIFLEEFRRRFALYGESEISRSGSRRSQC